MYSRKISVTFSGVSSVYGVSLINMAGALWHHPMQLASYEKPEFRTTYLTFKVEEHFIMEIDEQLITQVLINLIKNSVEAGAGKIELIGKLATLERPQIRIEDTGHGIDEENLDQIFIPFFSLKKEGSGIGLSLSRQIMSLHHGEISVASTDGSGTTIVLNF